MSQTNQIDQFSFHNFDDDEFSLVLLQEWDVSFAKSIPPITFIYIKEDNIDSRISLRKSINESNTTNYVLVSKTNNVAPIAWKANLMGFLDTNEGSVQDLLRFLLERIKKYPPAVEMADDKLKINFKGGFDLVNLSDICFCSGSGNYTEIYLHTGKKKCISYPLSKIEQRLSKVGHLDRIGKSFIINYNRVRSVKGIKLLFKGDIPLELELSSTYIKRIKKNLLWY